ncbi:hypothetical protein I8920_13155 [Curtobacterium sp. YC1]|uniref:hypothetical protein n=1 Tax=Curtobacterium sp. YC1 TaxID=2795488 RepID=UPI0018E59D19|nr:hypothetical protein [Curtobacterium sp. YC1]QQD75752.1 hypothetical protein I8920_13155 [Curtobacterium sp. YC1]
MPARRTLASAAIGSALVGLLLAGCSVSGDEAVPAPTRQTSVDGAGRTSGTSPAPTGEQAQTPQVLPVGAVAAETDVVSADGGTRMHVRVVANRQGTFDAELSGYRTTTDEWLRLEFRRSDADGGGDSSGYVAGVARWDPATSAPASVGLSEAGPTPDYLHSVALVPSSDDGDAGLTGDVPVLAVAPLRWTIPDPYPALRVVVGEARPGAHGWVHDRDGVPVSYQVATDDAQATVADRLGLTVAQLRWLNPTLPTDAGAQLITDTDLNLDPDER